MTLVDSSALEPLRRSGQWTQAIAAVSTKVRPFASQVTLGLSAHELPGRLAAMGYRVGVVTSSTRSYAEAVLKRFGVSPHALICGLEAGATKPDPAPIVAALKQLNVPPDKAAYVGDALEDYQAAYAAQVGSIGAGWAPGNDLLVKSAPDIRFLDPGLLLQPELLPRRGYIAEVMLANLKPDLHPGSILVCEKDHLALGRYYPLRAVDEHVRSLLSQSILKFKPGDSDLAGTFAAILTWPLSQSLPFIADVITSVPPKPNQNDRFDSMLSELRKHHKSGLMTITGSALEATREVQNYKGMGPGQRALAIKDVFKATKSWKGKRIIVVDDVWTFGGTLGDCTRALIESGAASVGSLALAIDQTGFGRRDCPACGGVLRIKRNGRDGSRFVGCSNYQSSGCRYTEPLT